MNRRLPLLLIVIIFTCAACSNGGLKLFPANVREVFQKSEELVLFSLEPDEPRGKENHPEDLHSWKVLGKTVIKDRQTRLMILNQVEKGMEENRDMVAECFQPRHAIRASHDGKTIDMLICFQCMNVYFFEENNDVPIEGELISRTPRELLNDILTKAGVPLPKKSDCE